MKKIDDGPEDEIPRCCIPGCETRSVATMKKGFLLWLEGGWLWLKYFFFFPIFGALPRPYAYVFARYLSRVDYWFNAPQKRAIRRWMTALFRDRRDLDATARRYFEVVYCDEVDSYIYLFGSRRKFLKQLRIEGEENLDEALRSQGGFILCTHFGGGFWALPFLKQKGVNIQFFSTDLRKEDYPFKRACYFYYKLSHWAIERIFPGPVVYKRDGRQSLATAVKEGKWVSTAYDVPPHLVRDNTEVSFLGRMTRFPRGVFSMAKELGVPVLFFFSFLEDGKGRKICFEKPICVEEEEKCVQESVRLIEKRIIERPDHWHLLPFAEQFFPQG